VETEWQACWGWWAQGGGECEAGMRKESPTSQGSFPALEWHSFYPKWKSLDLFMQLVNCHPYDGHVLPGPQSSSPHTLLDAQSLSHRDQILEKWKTTSPLTFHLLREVFSNPPA